MNIIKRFKIPVLRLGKIENLPKKYILKAEKKFKEKIENLLARYLLKNIKKRIQEKNKYKRLEELFDEIAFLFPNNLVSLTLHDIDLSELDRRIWRIDSDNTAERIKQPEEYFDIT